jgi:hypothetical protein
MMTDDALGVSGATVTATDEELAAAEKKAREELGKYCPGCRQDLTSPEARIRTYKAGRPVIEDGKKFRAVGASCGICGSSLGIMGFIPVPLGTRKSPHAEQKKRGKRRSAKASRKTNRKK